MTVRIVIVSDVLLYREGLVSALRDDPRIHVLHALADPALLLAPDFSLHPDVVVLDISFGVEIAANLARGMPRTRIVAFAISDVESQAVRCAEAGVAGYIPKDASIEDLVETVTSAAHGELRCSPSVAACLQRRLFALASRSAEPADHEMLTRRELAVVELIEKGLSNKQIARALQIEVSTAKNHVHRILAKLHVQRRGEAAAVVRRWRRSLDYTPMDACRR